MASQASWASVLEVEVIYS